MRNKQSSVIKKGSKRVLELWGGFLLSSVYVLNRTISSRTDKTPYELLFNKLPNVENLRVIGCRVYAHVPDQLRKKLDSKGQPCWLVGYPEDTKGWILWEPISRKFITSCDVIFNEDLLINDFNDETNEKETCLFDPFLHSTEILGLVIIIKW